MESHHPRRHGDDRSILLDYDDRFGPDGHWEDGHWSGAFFCASVSIIFSLVGDFTAAAVFFAAAVICACLPRWRRR